MSKGLGLHKADRVWFVSLNEEVKAEIHLDFWDQVDKILIYSDTSADTARLVYWLAASHTIHFSINRHCDTFTFARIQTNKYRKEKSERGESDRYMKFCLIPQEIKNMSTPDILKGFEHYYIRVITTIHKTSEEAIKDAVTKAGVAGLRYELFDRGFLDDEILMRLAVDEPNHFIFWKDEDKIPNAFDLHIVPYYHPVKQDWESVGMINGATDAYIGHKTIRSVMCPKDALAINERGVFARWDHVNNPFRAIGSSVTIGLIGTEVRSVEGVEELRKFIRGALGLDNQYVCVSGGFHAPMKCAHNRLVELKRKSPWPGADRHNIARGSEEHCVWAYRTLKAEGALEKSYVPAWFFEEDWLGIYEGAEIRHGLY